MEPILLDIPTELTTERLLLRMPRPRDGERVNAAIQDSAPELAKWMPEWARPTPKVEDTELWCRRAAVQFVSREQLQFSMYLKGTDTCLGNCGFPRLKWNVPRVEIGYWLRTTHVGQGYMTEAANALTSFAFDVLKVARVEIICDDQNARSRRVAERAGYTLEGIQRNKERDGEGNLRHICVYARTC